MNSLKSRISTALTLSLLALSGLAEAHTRITTDVNWGKYIRPILEEKCMTCHHPGGMAPEYVNLTIYGTDTDPGARAWAVAIEEEILTGRMPPFDADGRFGDFDSSKMLTEEEVDIILAWVRGGAPQGPERDIPMPEQFEKPFWPFGDPDLVIEADSPFTLAANESSGSRSYTSTIDIEEDTYITGYEFLVENPKNIHSITAWMIDPEGVEIAPLEVEVQLPYDPLADEDELEVTRLREFPKGPHLLGQWLRGDDPVLFPTAAGRYLRKGSTIKIDVEYARPEFADWSEEVVDNSKLGLFLALPDEEIDLLVESLVIAKNDFTVKANDANAKVETTFEIEEAINLIGVSPRLGTVPKNYEFAITYPDGRTSTLLWVPEFKWRWEQSYRFSEPVEAPVGSVLTMTAHFDNSEDNWDNPNSPAIDLAAGPGLEQPRMVTVIDYLLNDHLKVEEVFVPRERSATELEGTGMSLGSSSAFPNLNDKSPNPDEAAPVEGDEPSDAMKDVRENLNIDDSNIYWCPMRGNPCQLTDYEGEGFCDDCFMELKPKSFFFEGKELAPETADWKLSKKGRTEIYWCPNRGDEDHELLDYFAPGQCEVCGENLAHEARFETVHTYMCMIPDCPDYQKIYYGPGLCTSCGQPVSGMGHMDHTPMHGGWQFFMSDNLYHHLEGTMHEEGIFKLFMYDDWKVPLDARNFKAALFMEEENEATGEVTATEYELAGKNEGDTWLTAELPKEFPLSFYVNIWLAGEEKRYDFIFEELTPMPDPDAAPSEFRLHAHQCEAVTIPPTTQRIVEEIVKRDRMIQSRIENKDWLQIHCPAEDTKNLVAALA